MRGLPIPEYCYYSGKYYSGHVEPSNLAFELFVGCQWTCIPYRYISAYMLGSMEGETAMAPGGGVEQRARRFPEVSYGLLTYAPQSELKRSNQVQVRMSKIRYQQDSRLKVLHVEGYILGSL